MMVSKFSSVNDNPLSRWISRKLIWYATFVKIWSEGLSVDGWKEGSRDGFNIGTKVGFNDRESDGAIEGISDRLDKGINDGESDGLDKEINDGESDGMADSKSDGCLKLWDRFDALL